MGMPGPGSPGCRHILVGTQQLCWFAVGAQKILCVPSSISFPRPMLPVLLGRGNRGEAVRGDSAFLGELRGPGVPVLSVQAERVPSSPAEGVGIQRCNLHHLSLSGSWAAGKLHVFVLD